MVSLLCEKKNYKILFLAFFLAGVVVYVVPNLDIIKYNRHHYNCRIVVCPIGNLGNQIWEYMSLFAIWKKYEGSRYTPYLEKSMSENLKPLFPRLSIRPGIEDLCNDHKSKVIFRKDPLSVYDNWFNVGIDEKCENIFLDEYSYRYHDIVEYGVDEIRKEMSFAPQLVADSQSILLFHKQQLHMQSDDVIFVGMHYRGTDYDDHLKQIYDKELKLPTSKYYREAMEYFKSTYKDNNIIFILVTIDEKWLSKNVDEIVNSNNNVIVNPTNGGRLHDMVLLSQCNHTIINYGTFGTTAALLAGGTTFVYDLKLPPDQLGSTMVVGISDLLNDTWHKLS